eukprot:TRINITY_DN17630_c0_g1_i1.p1 TRINITY_DN17630_c0_g1~~TRINITY_DN17630_c0_g1_i1.p1  ORF type:complete len:958 (-),score=174.68 TRINITY_DN17630_c0_g1_i1:184-3057(-)
MQTAGALGACEGGVDAAGRTKACDDGEPLRGNGHVREEIQDIRAMVSQLLKHEDWKHLGPAEAAVRRSHEELRAQLREERQDADRVLRQQVQAHFQESLAALHTRVEERFAAAERQICELQCGALQFERFKSTAEAAGTLPTSGAPQQSETLAAAGVLSALGERIDILTVQLQHVEDCAARAMSQVQEVLCGLHDVRAEATQRSSDMLDVRHAVADLQGQLSLLGTPTGTFRGSCAALQYDEATCIERAVSCQSRNSSKTALTLSLGATADNVSAGGSIATEIPGAPTPSSVSASAAAEHCPAILSDMQWSPTLAAAGEPQSTCTLASPPKTPAAAGAAESEGGPSPLHSTVMTCWSSVTSAPYTTRCHNTSGRDLLLDSRATQRTLSPQARLGFQRTPSPLAAATRRSVSQETADAIRRSSNTLKAPVQWTGAGDPRGAAIFQDISGSDTATSSTTAPSAAVVSRMLSAPSLPSGQQPLLQQLPGGGKAADGESPPCCSELLTQFQAPPQRCYIQGHGGEVFPTTQRVAAMTSPRRIIRSGGSIGGVVITDGPAVQGDGSVSVWSDAPGARMAQVARRSSAPANWTEVVSGGASGSRERRTSASGPRLTRADSLSRMRSAIVRSGANAMPRDPTAAGSAVSWAPEIPPGSASVPLPTRPVAAPVSARMLPCHLPPPGGASPHAISVEVSSKPAAVSAFKASSAAIPQSSSSGTSSVPLPTFPGAASAQGSSALAQAVQLLTPVVGARWLGPQAIGTPQAVAPRIVTTSTPTCTVSPSVNACAPAQVNTGAVAAALTAATATSAAAAATSAQQRQFSRSEEQSRSLSVPAVLRRAAGEARQARVGEVQTPAPVQPAGVGPATVSRPTGAAAGTSTTVTPTGARVRQTIAVTPAAGSITATAAAPRISAGAAGGMSVAAPPTKAATIASGLFGGTQPQGSISVAGVTPRHVQYYTKPG